LVIEVLSPSIELYDRSRQFDLYRQIASLEEYVLVVQHSPRVEVFFRQSDASWLFNAYSGLDATAELRAVGISIPLSEIYEGVEFPPEADEPQ
jgi:Uma2 family endonuclease